MMKIKIDMDDFEKKLKVALEMTRIDVVNNLQDRLNPKHGKDTGVLQSSIGKHTQVKDNTLVIGMMEYGKYLEYGTPPHFPPPDKLQGWVRRKWGAGKKDGDTENKQGAFLLARHISKHGTAPYPFIRPMLHQDFNKILQRNLKSAFKN